MSYVGYPCRFCQRQRVMDEDGKHVCEKCRRDQATGEFIPEPDPIDELLREKPTDAERTKVASEQRDAIEQNKNKAEGK